MDKRIIVTVLIALFAFSSLAQDNRNHKVELYFGLAKKGRDVSEREWRAFVDKYVTPKFPSGLTVYDARGQWCNDAGKVTKEKTKVLMLICADTPVNEAAIKAIRKTYCDLYDQESVMEVDSEVSRVDF